MKRPAVPTARLRQLILGWTVVFSVLLGWIAPEPRVSDFPPRSASADLGAVLAPDHAAILTVSGKFHRLPESREGNDPDQLFLASDLSFDERGLLLEFPVCELVLPNWETREQRPEPRAPPII